MTSYSFVVPGQAIPKGRPRVMGAHTFTPARTKQYEKLVWTCAVQAQVKPIAGPVCIWLEFHLVRPDCCDIDNLAKSVLDALAGTAYADDRQVVELNLLKRASDKPHTKVVIYPKATT